jgi:hypothetical protein
MINVRHVLTSNSVIFTQPLFPSWISSKHFRLNFVMLRPFWSPFLFSPLLFFLPSFWVWGFSPFSISLIACYWKLICSLNRKFNPFHTLKCVLFSISSDVINIGTSWTLLLNLVMFSTNKDLFNFIHFQFFSLRISIYWLYCLVSWEWS